MNLKSKDMDMLHGALTGKLLYFTLPIALSSMIQQLFNAADTAVVGYFGNAGALAAVGTNTEIIALIVTVSSGLSVGINILIANHIGRNETAEIPAAIQTAIAGSTIAMNFEYFTYYILRHLGRQRPLSPARTSPPRSWNDAGAFCGCVWYHQPYAALFRFLR